MVLTKGPRNILPDDVFEYVDSNPNNKDKSKKKDPEKCKRKLVAAKKFLKRRDLKTW